MVELGLLQTKMVAFISVPEAMFCSQLQYGIFEPVSGLKSPKKSYSSFIYLSAYLLFFINFVSSVHSMTVSV